MNKINIKPLSVNAVWQGKRFKNKLYKQYEMDVSFQLPKFKLPEPPFRIYFEFGVSSKLADIDNPVKPFMDILQKKYGFNDREVYEMTLKKVDVKKGNEYIKWHIESTDLENLFG